MKIDETGGDLAIIQDDCALNLILLLNDIVIKKGIPSIVKTVVSLKQCIVQVRLVLSHRTVFSLPIVHNYRQIITMFFDRMIL